MRDDRAVPAATATARFVVDPWPFAAASVAVGCEARLLEGSFAGDAALARRSPPPVGAAALGAQPRLMPRMSSRPSVERGSTPWAARNARASSASASASASSSREEP